MLLSALLVAGLSAGADSTLLRILAINDFHGALEARVFGWSAQRPAGGAAALKATLDRAAAECRCVSFRFDGGDQMQGTLASNLVHGRSTIEALNAVGLDAASLGNHDFDWGVDTLRARMREARYPWLAANIFDSASGRRPGWVVPWALVQKGGLRVAVVGYITPVTKTIVKARHVAGLRFGRGLAAIADVLDSARAANPDLTVIVAHEGALCDTLVCRGAIVDLARELDSTRVQAIVAGHTHTLVNTSINGIPIVQARANSTAYGVADWIRRDDGSRYWRVRVETVWADQTPPDSAMEAILARYRPAVDRLAKRVIARLRDSLPASRDALGDLIADAHRAAVPGTDFALMNNGGIRRDLYAGPLTYNDLFELQPFGNNVVRIRLTGEQLTAALEYAVRGPSPAVHVSGLTVRYDGSQPPGRRIVALVRPDGSRVRPARRYTLAVNDFVAGGGDGFAMLSQLPAVSSGMTDLEAVIEYLRRQRQPVVAPAGRRFRDVARSP